MGVNRVLVNMGVNRVLVNRCLSGTEPHSALFLFPSLLLLLFVCRVVAPVGSNLPVLSTVALVGPSLSLGPSSGPCSFFTSQWGLESIL